MRTTTDSQRARRADDKARRQRRAQASRENARHSTGPRTPEGKARSCRNRTTHGLCTKTLHVQEQDQPAFQALLDAHYHHIRPRTQLEADLTTLIAAATWRGLEAQTHETNQLTTARRLLEQSKQRPHSPTTLFALAFDQTKPVTNRYLVAARNKAHRALQFLASIRAPFKPNNSTSQAPTSPSAHSRHHLQ